MTERLHLLLPRGRATCWAWTTATASSPPGADWIDNNKPDYFPVYGDPYDLMSSATFGAADPTTHAASRRRAGRAPLWGVRAAAHRARPAAPPEAGRRSRTRAGSSTSTSRRTSHHALPGGDGDGRQARAHRVPPDRGGRRGARTGLRRVPATVRPQRLLPLGRRAGRHHRARGRDRCGDIVHTIVDQPGVTPGPVVWYAGRIVFPTPDTEVAVDTPLGQCTWE